SISGAGNSVLTHLLAVVFFLIAVYFIWRSFYGMRIGLDLVDVKRELSDDLPADQLTGSASAAAVVGGMERVEEGLELQTIPARSELHDPRS
ncbi:MAG: hypothetical protein KDB34_01835, partial [Propionibacteriaceae bacterium]|nr:hypothetical protein [Propionibacteriaceae bacterium]